MAEDSGLMKMAELVAAAGISKQTIHFYLREGLLSPPVRTGRNIAWYDERHVRELRMIKELQEKHYYPLSLIRTIMEGWRQGKDIGTPDHLEAFDEYFDDVSEGAGAEYDLGRFIKETGLSSELVQQLAEAGMIGSRSKLANEGFSNYDLALGRSLKRIADLGFTENDLLIYRDYLDLMRREVLLAHDRIVENPLQQPHPPLADIRQALDQIKLLLTKQALREIVMDQKHHSEPGERGGKDA
ncbi:MAG: MerR family transcriptional regulator [Deltaproteobacteria bacterium]